jgi:hypothetical protein
MSNGPQCSEGSVRCAIASRLATFWSFDDRGDNCRAMRSARGPVDLDRAPGRRNGGSFASARDPAVTWVGVLAQERLARLDQKGGGARLGVITWFAGRSPSQSQPLWSYSNCTWATRAMDSLSSMTLRCYTLNCDAIRYSLSHFNFPRFPIVQPSLSLYVSRG